MPRPISTRLFGDRHKYGYIPQENDPNWKEWENETLNFYHSTQKSGIGKRINDAGYHVLSLIDVNNKKILEIGPGEIIHINHWHGYPSEYVVVDRNEKMLKLTADIFLFVPIKV